MSTIEEKTDPPPDNLNAVDVVDVEKEGSGTPAKHVDSRIIKHSHDVDEAMKAFEGVEGQVIAIDEATNRRLLRTIDWHLMPLMCIVYGMNYLDSKDSMFEIGTRSEANSEKETTISYASIMGLKTDLNLVGDDYQWLGSLFYFGMSVSSLIKSTLLPFFLLGYLGWEFPTTQLLRRMPLGKYSAVCIILWGFILACFAGVSNFGGAVAIRFFLGIFEAAVTPGFALLTSQWWTKKEQGQRTGIWFSFNGVGQIVGGLIAYGIAVGTREHGSTIEPWKIIFLATGLFTICLGFYFLYLIPDNQLNARWLSPEDRILAVERVRINQQGIGNKHFKFYQFKEALFDPMVWAFVFYALLADIPNGGISNFFSQLVRTLSTWCVTCLTYHS